jgi:Leucine-rich repeat (LRR) protein
VGHLWGQHHPQGANSGCNARFNLSPKSQTLLPPVLPPLLLFLQSLPEQLSLLTGLQHLDLSKNRLQQLPPSLTPSLSHLTLLDISGNHLDATPSLGTHMQLQHLSLGLNYLKTMSCSFRKLSGCLVSLELPHVASCLPDAWGVFQGLGELGGLTRLNVSCNQLKGLPEEWGEKFTQLKVWRPQGSSAGQGFAFV